MVCYTKLTRIKVRWPPLPFPFKFQNINRFKIQKSIPDLEYIQIPERPFGSMVSSNGY